VHVQQLVVRGLISKRLWWGIDPSVFLLYPLRPSHVKRQWQPEHRVQRVTDHTVAIGHAKTRKLTAILV
jgi:hypothetical protein